MADPITWYALGRVVDDPETIMEEIDAKMLSHNLDPSAHGQAGEGLWTHRAAELLDHVSYSIYNLKIAPAARVFKAIVAGGGDGDFTTIQAAIDYANLHGGGTVFIRAGTYNLNDFITLYDNITLLGEGPGLTFLNFTTDSKNIRAIGAGRTPTCDSYSINNGSKVVTGVNSNFFTTIEVGDYIKLDNIWYKINSVDSDTQLTLRDTYRGSNIAAGGAPSCADFIEDFKIEGLTVQGCTGPTGYVGSGIYLSYAAFFEVKNVLSRSNQQYGFYIENSDSGRVVQCNAIDNGVAGFYVYNFTAGVLHGCGAFDSPCYGFNLSNAGTFPCQITDCFAAHNGYHGFSIINGSYFTLKGCNGYDNTQDGFYIAGGNYNSWVSCQANANGRYGLDVAEGSSTKNVIVACVALNNASGNLFDSGTSTEKGHNITA
jgi:hypothetical protein